MELFGIMGHDGRERVRLESRREMHRTTRDFVLVRKLARLFNPWRWRGLVSLVCPQVPTGSSCKLLLLKEEW